MDYKNPPPSAWVFARLALALAIAGVLAHRWEQGLLTWPLILMSGFILGLLLLEMFTADRKEDQRNFDADGRPVSGLSSHRPRRRGSLKGLMRWPL